MSPTPLTPKHKQPERWHVDHGESLNVSCRIRSGWRIWEEFLTEEVGKVGSAIHSGQSAPKARMWVTRTQQGLCTGGFLTCVSEPEGEILPYSANRTCFPFF